MAPKTALPRVNAVDFYRLHEEELLHLFAGTIADLGRRSTRWKPARAHVALHAWSRLLGDVQNGGFTQFFYNNGGDAGVTHAAALIESLGLPKAAGVLNDAVAVYRRHKAAFNVKNPWEGLFGSIEEFERLDRTFSRSALGIARKLEKWLRLHVQELATDEAGQPIDPKLTGLVEARTADGTLTHSLEVKNGKPHGACREFFEDGSVRHGSFYKSGELSGDFWPDGQIKCKSSRRGAQKVIEWFHPGGQLQKRFVMDKNGKAAEPVREYHPNGQLAEEVHIAKGEKVGPWLRYFPDGSPKLEAEHRKDGQLVVWNAWDDDRTRVVKNGSGTFREDGRDIVWPYDLFMQSHWIKTLKLKGGIPHGETATYHVGVLWATNSYKNGRLDGNSKMYWDNGRVRAVTRFSNGKAGKREEFPKFDDPRPAVVLSVEANEELYTAWDHPRVDEYPLVQNLDEVQRQLVVPTFLKEVHERNVAGSIREDYEDWNTFDDGIAYFLVVDGNGRVISAKANGSGVYSGGSWDVYPPFLRKLRFRPGSARGRPVECRVLARVDHTFVESRSSR